MLNQDHSRKELQEYHVNTDCTSAKHPKERGSNSNCIEFPSLLKRKYEQMSLIENDVDGDRLKKLDTATANFKRRAVEGNDEDPPHAKRLCREIASCSPGSNSDITTEHYMAESSKSSCFDDACTLALEAATAAGESAASTSELVHPKNDDNNLDLNDPSHQVPEEKQAAEAPRNFENESITEERHFVSLLMTEEEKSESELKRTGKGIEYSPCQDWLQLGLGPSSTSKFTSSKPHLGYAAGDENVEEPEDGQKQQSPVLRLFPSDESDYNPSQRKASPHWGATHTGSAETSDYYLGPFQPLGTRFGRTAAEVEAQARQQGEGFTSFLKTMKQASDTPLVVSYNTTPSGHGMYAADAQRPEQHRSANRLSMFNEFAQPPPYHEPVGVITEAPLHGGYGYGVSDGNFQSSQPYVDKHFLSRSVTNASGRSMQQEIPSWKQEGFHPFPPRPGFYLPLSGNIGPPAATFHPSPRTLPNQSEDWQTLVKRLGGSMHFPSLLPMSKATEGIEDWQRSSNLQDLRAQWNNPDIRASTGSWSKGGHVMGSFGGPEMASKRIFSFPSMEGSRAPSQHAQGHAQGWQPSGLQLPYLPTISQHMHPLGASKERLKMSVGAKDQDLWFFLRARGNQDSEQLPQIPKGYLRVKDGTVPVSYVKKYLVHKLGLLCESEVEISCRGQILLPSMSLQHVRDVIWYSCAQQHTGDEEALDTAMAHTAQNIVMELNYRRQPHFLIEKQ